MSKPWAYWTWWSADQRRTARVRTFTGLQNVIGLLRQIRLYLGQPTRQAFVRSNGPAAFYRATWTTPHVQLSIALSGPLEITDNHVRPWVCPCQRSDDVEEGGD
jgi:hypothetical protein